MLPAGASEGDHQMLEAAALVLTHAGLNQFHGGGEKLLHHWLPVQIFHHCGILSAEPLEPLLPPRIGQRARIEDKASAVAALVGQRTAMKRKTGDQHGQYGLLCRKVGLGWWDGLGPVASLKHCELGRPTWPGFS